MDPGFQPDRVLTLEMNLRTAQYAKDPAILNFWQQVLDRVRSLPAVQAVAFSSTPRFTLIPGRDRIS